MLIIPAVDILDGKVVRLYRGKRELSKVYSEDPVKTAQGWIDAGAELLHVVDLNATFGQGDNLGLISQIAKLGISLQVGGGIRTIERAKRLLNMGVARIILGTKATDENFLATALETLGERLGVSVDTWAGLVRYDGWRKQSGLFFVDFIKGLLSKGVKWIIYTDIVRDGTLTGPNIENIKMLAQLEGPNYIISGGISSIDDLKMIKKEAPHIYGVIVGKSLYEGKINLGEALTLFKT
jgi:phosphoribosylformimino-5-aminoimidazole carboxamide ribotide isomerase